jgi:zinc finger protein
LILRKIERAKEGRLKFTLVLKDPFGNSAIVSEKARRRRIGKRELSRLKFGEQALAVGK